MDKVFPDQAAAWCQGQWYPHVPPAPIRQVCVDSRAVQPGSLFVALKGERVDGHDFLPAVAAAQAYALVREDIPTDHLPIHGFFLRVADPLAALGRLAAGYRQQMPARMVGITGSVGKTTTKELAADMLATIGKTTRTAGNFNNEIGLPLSLLTVEQDSLFGVIEAGISHPGEMALLRDILMPDLAVMTGLAEVHIEFFESLEAIAAEKATLLEKLPADGAAILDRDDRFFPLLREHCSAPVVTCSLKRREADYAGDALGAGQLWVCERATGETVELVLPPPGGFMAENVLRAVAVARTCGASWEGIAAALEQFRPVGMRWAVETVQGWRIVNDAYNANPRSMRASLTAFADWPVSGRKFLVLGPMLELGRHLREEHEALGRFVAAGKWAGVAIVPQPGGLPDGAAQGIWDGLHEAGWPADRVVMAAGSEEAAAWLRLRLQSNDALLLKASRGIQLEKVVTELKKEI
ncbi:MAG: UDP-N-acetylmuramoyl-tripeptide--D-alanyl-D-alanine ligase [Kiritimatiellia bacterium]|jgi:UDP-N-acetylmuramoyl-tripeptide--D-alanyl-D-alanine ligase|nr:UDP-N-acetylmuramoyl-tripeptide--D-alanyl-D-alanine ligase [Kiritimatiellia bacterium]